MPKVTPIAMLVAKDWIRQESMGQALSKCVSHCDGRFVSLLTTPLLCSELFFRIRPLQIVLIGLQMAASNRVLPHFPRRRCSWSGVVWCGVVTLPCRIKITRAGEILIHHNQCLYVTIISVADAGECSTLPAPSQAENRGRGFST